MITIISLTLIAILIGCAPAASADVLQSDLPRETPDPPPANDLQTLVDGNNAFAFALYRQAVSGDDNVFFSPYSISLALAMAYAGAEGDTEAEMGDALRYHLSQDRLHPAFNYLDQQLATRGQDARGKDEDGFRLNVVNAAWGQEGYPFLSEYLDVLARNYGAGLRILDFVGNPEGSRNTINDWVEEQTEERIQDLIPQGAIDELTRLVLTNAVYFNAAWESQFEEGATSDAPFHLLDGTETEVPMMRQMASFGHYRGSNYHAVELPYDGREISMVVLVPDRGEFDRFESDLDHELVREAIDNLERTEVRFSMPRFSIESTLDLKAALSAMGMQQAFDPRVADFSGMDDTRELYISDVLHKAFVDVDEDGTEAAAATAVVVGTTSAPLDPVEVTLDRPFIFLIRDMETNTTLFIGRVTDPA